jgi:phage protein D
MIYFTPDIKQSINRNKSVFPMELEFTLDGINGFKYGDVLAVAGLPRRYREAFVFTIIGVDHSVSNDGEWTTKIKCNARARIK